MTAHSKRPAILLQGLDLVHRNGFTRSGVASITMAGRAPKGSFYNHFKSKDDFGLAILDEYFEAVRAAAGQRLQCPARPPRQRLEDYFAFLRDLGREDAHLRGCLIGNLSAEVASTNEPLRRRLQQLLAEWTAMLAGTVAEAQEAGAVRRDIPAETLAGILLDAWQGALLRAKVDRGPASLDAFMDVLLPALLRPEAP